MAASTGWAGVFAVMPVKTDSCQSCTAERVQHVQSAYLTVITRDYDVVYVSYAILAVVSECALATWGKNGAVRQCGVLCRVVPAAAAPGGYLRIASFSRYLL